jgi:hypothetical protein
MLAFRSEAHVHRWLETHGLPQGATLSLDQAWRLADAWYSDRLDPTWRRKTPAESEALFAEIGFEGDFWRLQ